MNGLLESLHPGLQRRVTQKEHWSDLTPIQKVAIPVILAGTDCVIEAPTAGGKTEAVLFPCLTRITSVDRSRPSVRILYLAPLRALLNNLQRRGEKYAEDCGLHAFKWHGDVGQKEKLDALRTPPDLLMTTPESLEAILLRKSDWPEFLAGLSCVIIDEAHNFADGDRGGHLLCLLERVEQVVDGPPPQRIAMSATVGNPEAMLRWLAGTRRQPGQRIQPLEPPGSRSTRDYKVLLFEDIYENGEVPAAGRATFRRFQALQQLLERGNASPPRSLVFVRSRRGAEALAKSFAKVNEHRPAGRKLEVRTHHSAVSKYFREDAENLIQLASESGIHAIISTSTLELGIDIGALDRVIQVDALGSPSSFLQRVGRTGRRPGKPQFFRGLLTNEDDLPVLAATVSLGYQGRSEALHLAQRAFHLLAHQLLCLSLQSFGISIDQAWAILSGASCFSAIRRTEVEHLADHMVAEGYLRRVDGVLVVGPKTEKSFLHSNWRRLFAVFDSAALYEIFHQRQQVGTLDASFVEALEVPFFFVLGGRLWRADRVDPRRRKVEASPSKEGNPPRWQSFGGPDVPFETAQEAGRLLHASTVPEFLNEEGRRAFEYLRRQAALEGWTPMGIQIQVSAGGSGSIITYAGDRINRTLARLLSHDGVGDATADYREVKIQKGPAEPHEMREMIHESLENLRDGERNDVAALNHVLEQLQPLYPFSPFARCLPPALLAATLVEQTLDPGGLLELVSSWTVA